MSPAELSVHDVATDRPVRPGVETAVCAAGSFLVPIFPGLGTLAMVYGAWLLFRPQEGRGLQAVVACLVPLVVLCLVSWDALGSLVVPYAPCALVIARVLPGRSTITGFSVVAVSLKKTLLGLDAAYLASVGSDLVSQMEAVIASAKELTLATSAVGASSIQTSTVVEEVYDLMRKVWPVVYVMRAAIVVGLGFVGLALARRVSAREVYEAFKRYDVPLWVVAALVIAILCLGLTSAGLVPQTPFESVGLCLFFCVRFLLFAQGIAVALDRADAYGLGTFARVAVVIGLTLAEMGLFAGCALGVVDVWANFRSLPRKGVARDEVGK